MKDEMVQPNVTALPVQRQAQASEEHQSSQPQYTTAFAATSLSTSQRQAESKEPSLFSSEKDDGDSASRREGDEDAIMPTFGEEMKGRQRLGSFSTINDEHHELAQQQTNASRRSRVERMDSRRLSLQVSQQMSKHLSVFTALPPVPVGYDDQIKEFSAYPARHSIFRQSALITPSPSQQPAQEKGDDLEDSRPAVETEEDENSYPGQKQRLLIVLAILMACFLTALDRTIIATAIPRITDEFNSLGDIAWYGSAFFLTSSCFQLLFGRLYSFNSPKYVFLTCMLIFEVGSALCGAAPDSKTLIIGRAVAGLGTAGIMSGAIIMMITTIPLQQRPLYQGLFGGVFGASSVAGPLIGGAFTTNLNWRWCFYINLPIGGAAILLLFFVLPNIVPTEPGKSWKQQIKEIDLLGEFFLFPSVVCLLLALQWGGSKYSWDDWRVVLLFVVFAGCLVGFVVVQMLCQQSATIKASAINNRSMIAACFFTFTLTGGMIIAVYFLPLWFQAIKNVSALQSGIYGLPVIIASVLGSVVAGVVVSKLGYYVPFMILGSIMGAIGLGLMSTFTIDSPSRIWIGYQIILGFGLGGGMQQGSLVAQTVLKKADANMGVSILFLVQQIGSAIFLSVGENVFTTKLIENLQKVIPGINPKSISGTGATDLRDKIPAEILTKVLTAYNGAIQQLFIAGAILACISLIGASGVEWISVRKKKAADAEAAGTSTKATTLAPTTLPPAADTTNNTTSRTTRRQSFFARFSRHPDTHTDNIALDMKPRTNRHHTVKIRPASPSTAAGHSSHSSVDPAMEKAFEAGSGYGYGSYPTSERISQAPTAVSDDGHGAVDMHQPVIQTPRQVAERARRVRHVAELVRAPRNARI